MQSATRLFAVGTLLVILAPFSAGQQVHVEADWFQNPDNCHWYGVDYSMHLWADSEALAVSLGGHLVTVRSQGEQDWIESIFPAYQLDSTSNGGLWLGYHKPAGSWVWVSGEPNGYENWAIGQPDGSGTEAQLVTDDDHPCCGPHTWDDIASTDLRPLLELDARPRVGWSWPRQYPTGNFPLYGALADLDGDKDLDYATPLHDDDKLVIFWNDGAGLMLPGPELILGTGRPHQVAALDHDQDGDKDLVVTIYQDMELLLVTNNGDSTFTVEPTTLEDSAQQYHGVTVVDANGDAFLDLAVTSVSDSAVRVLVGQAGGLFTVGSPVSVGSHPWFMASVDLDDDGDKDLAVSNTGGDSISVLANDGLGGLTSLGDLPTGGQPRGLVAGDVDGDGDADLCVASFGDGNIEIWLNDGTGSFTQGGVVPVGVGPNFCDLADFDGDGDLDVVSAVEAGTLVSWNDGAGTFSTSSTLSGGADNLSVVTGNLDGDFSPDVLVGSRGDLSIDVHLNHHDVDCNGNGVLDSDDIANGTSSDCDSNGLLDECEIAVDPGLDWNGDGVLDECSTANYCTATDNSTGFPAVIGASGSPLIADNDFTLEAWDLPTNEFGYFLTSESTDFVPGFGGSSGNLCLGSPIFRFNNPMDGGEVLNSGSMGTVSFTLDLTDLPQAIVFFPGDTWYFQLWFRDWVNGSSTSNTTDGLEVMFK